MTMAVTTRVVDYDQLYPGRFIKAGDLAGKDVTLTIASVELEELEDQKGKRGKGVITFRETKKQLVLNRTNGECIKAMFGRVLADWIGKRIALYPAAIQSEVADLAVRIRGSPDIAADVTFELHLARKRPRPMTMKRTAGKGQAASAPASQPTPDGDPQPAEETDALAEPGSEPHNRKEHTP
jgi:predicted YcjX-like family ATPase